MLTVFYSLAGIGAWTIASSAFLYFRDRSGNSGRETHWRDNPRLHGPDEQ